MPRVPTRVASLVVALVVMVMVLTAAAAPTEATPMRASAPPHEPISPNKRTLALLDDAALKTSCSDFFTSLTQRGHQITYIKLKDGLSMTMRNAGGEWEYDHVVILGTQSVEPLERMLTALLEFADAGGNILVGTTPKTGKWMGDLLTEFGVSWTFAGTEAVVTDRFPPSNGSALVMAPWPVDEFSERVVGKPPSASAHVAFSGYAVSANELARQLGAVPVLRAPATAFAGTPKPNVAPLAAGAELVLAWGVQNRNNARFTIVGGVTPFLNENAKTNGVFLSKLAAWTFAERGMLRVVSFKHAREDGSAPERQDPLAHEENPLPPSTFPDPDWDPNTLLYREKDKVVVTLVVQRQVEPGVWEPFNANDMQLEFVMLDPYVRVTMKPQGSNGTLVGRFTVPDHYGVFRIRIKYNRPGLSSLLINQQVSVRPFRHDEYERFILAASPYYVSVVCLMAGFFFLSAALVKSK